MIISIDAEKAFDKLYNVHHKDSQKSGNIRKLTQFDQGDLRKSLQLSCLVKH